MDFIKKSTLEIDKLKKTLEKKVLESKNNKLQSDTEQYLIHMHEIGKDIGKIEGLELAMSLYKSES